jgi:hypothetical protein
VLNRQTARSSADPLESFASGALELAMGAVQASLTARLIVRFGPVSVCMESCGSAITRLALESVRHAEDAGAVPHLRIIVLDSKEKGITPPPDSPFRRPEPTYSTAMEVGGNLRWRTWRILDRKRKLGLVWSADAAATPQWVILDQIRHLLHWWSKGQDWGVLHAAALKLGPAGCLVAGMSGSGKSTLTAAAIAAGFDTAGDDFVMIEPGPEGPLVHSIFHVIKLDERSLDRVPAFRGKAFRAIEAPEEKFLIYLFEAAPKRIASGFRLHAILHSRVSGKAATRIVPSRAARAFAALTPSTIFELRSQEDEIVSRTAALARTLPAYSLELGTDIDAAIGTLRRFMTGLVQ